MTIQAIIPLVIMGGAFLLIAIVAHTTGQGNLDHIKSKTVGDGQHGTARWATKKEIQQTFKHIPFRPEAWRKGKNLPTDQGLVLGCVGGGPDIGSLWVTLFKQRKKAPERPAVQALVDTDDIHCLMIGASGIGKTAFFLYSNLELSLIHIFLRPDLLPPQLSGCRHTPAGWIGGRRLLTNREAG